MNANQIKTLIIVSRVEQLLLEMKISLLTAHLVQRSSDIE